MTATSTQPKTIENLLAEGQKIIRQQEQVNRARQQVADEKRRQSWGQLVARARMDLGELADDLPSGPPDDFGDGDSHGYTLRFRPFGAAWLSVDYWEGSAGWKRSSDYGSKGAIWAQTKFEPEWEDGEWHVRPAPLSSFNTDSLAEAVAVCFKATAAYHVCEQECAQKAPPAPAKSKEPEIHLLSSERDFILALRRVIGDRIPE